MTTPPAIAVSAVLLVDQRIQGYETIVSSVKDDVRCIVFHPNQVSEHCSQQSITSFQYILNKIAELGVSSFANIGIIQHNNNTPLHQFFGVNPSEISTVAGVETSDPSLQTWASVAGFITTLKTTYGIQNVDLMACALYSDVNWKYIIDTLSAQTAVEIRASTDNTGSAAMGGNWFLESHTGVNLKGVYFTDAIEEYRGVLYLAPFNIRENSTKGFATGSIISWGMRDSGGTSPAGLSSVVAVYSHMAGFLTLSTDGNVIVWGGIQLPVGQGAQVASDVVAVYSNGYAAAALKSNGSIVTWGQGGSGNQSEATWYNGSYNYTSVANNLTSGVVAVYSTQYAFAALKNDGSIVTWGNTDAGGANPSITGVVVSVYSTERAFTALKNDGSIVTWGNSSFGGTNPNITGVVVAVYSTELAFTALKSDGSIVTWGNDGVAAGMNPNITGAVVAVYSTQYAFAALKSDGSVVSWGDSYYGGNSSSVASSLTSGVVSVYSTERAFTALKSDGSVVSWGPGVGAWPANYGGTNPNITGVVAVYSNNNAFAALKSDGSVVSWGNSSLGGSGGASGAVAVYSSGSAFAALKSDGSVVTWGNAANGGNSSIAAWSNEQYNYNSVESNLTSGIAAVYSNSYAFAALKTTATTFDLSMSYYRDIDRYDILRKKENRRRVNLTTLNNNVFTLSTARDIQSFNPWMPTDKVLRIIVPTYQAPNSYSITSTATIPSGAGSVIIACDDGEPVTISGVTYVNYGSYVYKLETNNTYTKLTTATIEGNVYNLYGGDGINSSGIALIRVNPMYGTFTPPAKTILDTSFSMVPYAPTTDSSGVYTYTSSAPEVATISSDGTVVGIVGLGSTTITVSQDICGIYLAGSKTGTLTITRKAPAYGIFTPPEKTILDTSFSMVPYAPTTDNSGVYTYTSSAPEVATISSDGTVVTILRPGSTTITVSQDICGNYAAGSQTGLLTIAGVVVTYGAFTPPAKTFGDASFSMVPFAPTTDSSGAYTYTSSAPSVATISSDGTVVTIIGQGSTTITASQDICGNYAAGSQTGTLIVARKAPVYGTFTPPAKTILDTSFSMVPFAPTTESSGAYTYTSSAPEVATINSNGTVVGIVGLGSTTITVSQDICGNYLAGSQTGTLTIARKVPVYGAFTPPAKTFGDASFSMVPFAPTSESIAAYTYTSSDPEVATISSDGTVVTIVGRGSTTITASQQDICGNYLAGSQTGTLTIAGMAVTYGAFTPPAKTFGDASFSMVPFAPTSDSSGVYTYTSTAFETALSTTISASWESISLSSTGRYRSAVVSGGNIQTSSDYGVTWTERTAPGNRDWRSISLSSTGQYQSAVPYGPAFIWTSSDYGVTWTARTNAGSRYWYSISLSSTGQYQSAGGYGAGNIWTSSDYGATWTPRTAPGSLNWYSVSLSSTGQYQSAVVESNIWTSSDFGVTWTVRTAPGTRYWRSISLSSTGEYQSAGAGDGNIWTSSDYGVTWTVRTAPGRREWYFISLSSTGKYQTAVVLGGAIWTSSDFGVTWTERTAPGSLNWRSISLSSTGQYQSAVAYGGKIWASSDFGVTWSEYASYIDTENVLNVATISSDGTVVTIVRRGTTLITASQDICGNYAAGSKTGTLTIAGMPVTYGAFNPPAKTFGDASFSMVPFAPTTDSSGAYTYTSSNTSVATINSTGTVVTIIGQGSTTITASQDICGNYAAGSQTGTLTVARKVPVYGTFVPPAKTFGDASFSMVPYAPISESSGVYTYTSSDPEVATISSDGTVVTIINNGSTTITASQDICGNYLPGSQTGTFTVARKVPVYGTFTPPAKTFGDASFSMVPFAPTSESSGVYTYTSATFVTATSTSISTSWTSISLSSTGQYRSAVVANGGNIWTSSDYGVTWTARTAPESRNWTSISVSSTGQYQSVVVSGGNIWTSSDYGVTWTARTAPGSRFWQSISLSSTGEYQSAGVYNSNIWTSSDYGVTWTERTTPGSREWNSISLSSTGQYQSAVVAYGNIWTSSDYGVTWTARTAPGSRIWESISLSSTGQYQSAVVNNGNIWTSSDYGITWTARTAPGSRYWRSISLSSTGQYQSAAVQGGGNIWTSSDFGVTWTDRTNAGSRNWYSISLSSTGQYQSAVVWAGTIWSSYDFGVTWSEYASYYDTDNVSNVATISSDGTVVEIVGRGTAGITVSQDICGNYAASSKTGLLIVAGFPVTYGEFNPPAKTFGDASFSMVPFAPTTDSSGAYTYTSSNTSVATINSSGTVVTIVGQGTTTITASQDVCGNYAAGSQTGTLTVARKVPAYGAFTPPAKTFGNAAFSMVPFAPTSESIAAYTYTSSNTSVATINSAGTVVTIVGQGSTTITATQQDICGNYAAGSKTGTLTVARKVPVYGTFTPPAKTYGDASFSMVPFAPTSESSGVYTYTNSSLIRASSTTPCGDGYSISLSSSGQYQSRAPGEIFTSSDYGFTWTARNVSAFAISVSSTGQYQSAVRTNYNIWTSSDYGVTWTARTNAGNRDWRLISVSSTGQYQSALAYGDILTSSDYGVTWSIRYPDIYVGNWNEFSWNSISLSSTGQYQTAMGSDRNMTIQWWQSSNYGVTWSRSTIWPYVAVQRISLSSSGQYQVGTGSYIWTSSDFGVTWTERTASGMRSWRSISLSSTGQYLSAIGFTPGTNNNGNIWTSSDYGVTWTERITGANRIWVSIAVSSTGQYQIATVQYENIWFSSDYGVTWSEYASYYDNENVATISSDGTVVEIVGRGTTQITASQDICGNYAASSKTGLLIIAGFPVTYGAFNPPAMTFGDASFSMVPYAPTTDSSGVYTYTSSVPSVATISSDGTVVTIIGQGSTTITASQDVCGNYAASSKTGTLTVARKAPVYGTFIPPAKTFGNAAFSMVPFAPTSESSGAYTYTSSNTSVATINSTGTVVTIVGQGSTTITASQDICGNYLAGSQTGTFTVARKVPAYGTFIPPAKTILDTSFSMVPFAPTTESNATYTYTSSAPEVATISSDGTVVTIIGLGSTTITVSQEISGNYAVGSKTGTLTITRKIPDYGAFVPPAKTFGDASFSMVPFAPTSESSGVYTYTSSAPSVATISSDGTVVTIIGQGSTTITASQDICGNYQASSKTGTLTVARKETTYGTFTPPAKTFGDAAFSIASFAPITDNSGIYRYTSSNTSVATINSAGTVVTIIGQGSTTITAIQDICGNYLAGSQTGTLTVARKVPAYGAFTPPAKTFGDASFSMVPFAPTSESIAAYTYTSSDPSVATINSAGTVVTIINNGSTTITATQQDICGNYLAGSQTGTFTVARKVPVYGTFTPPAKTYGDASFSMVPYAPTSESSGVYTYTSTALVTASSTSISTSWQSISLSSTGQYRSAAVQGGNIWTSSDYGVTWTARTNAGGRNWQSISLSSTGQYQSGSSYGPVSGDNICTSSDYGITWTVRTAPGSRYWTSISVSSTGQYQSTVDSNGGNIWTSSDYGVTWTARTAPGSRNWTSISVSSTGQYQSAGVYGGNIWTSTDYGVTWTERSTGSTRSWYSISLSSTGQYQSAVVIYGTIWTSSDYGVTWTVRTAPGNRDWTSLSLSSTGQYQSAAAQGGNIWTSSDYGATWAARTAPGSLNWGEVSLSSTGQYQSAVAYGGKIWSSTDYGVTWSEYASYYDLENVSPATISSDGTVVTIVRRGTAGITVSQDICGNYAASSKTSQLIIAGMPVTYGAFTPPDKTFGDASFSMVPFAPSTDSSGAYTYTSSNTSVATINSTGTVVTIIGQGSTTITASQDICGNYATGSQTGTLTIARKAPVYGTFTPPAKTFGDAAFSMVPFAPTSESTGVYTYTSSDPSVATINSAGTVVTIIGQGSTTITASQDICGNYLAGSQTGTFTVARKVPVYGTFVPPAKTFGDASFSMVPFAPTSESSATYTYTSSAPSVATISSDGTVVTIIGQGSATITVSQEISGNYAVGSKTATLTVARKVPVYGEFTPPDKTFGDASFSMVPFAPTSESSGAYTYTSSAPSVATISSDGTVVTIIGQGSATITASQDICGNYTASSKTGTLTVARKAPVYGTFTPPAKTFGDAAFSMVSFAPTSESTGVYTYTSSDTSVATINSAGTVVTIVGQGSTTITASQDICGNYLAGSQTGTLTVERKVPAYGTFTPPAKTFGDASFSMVPFAPTTESSAAYTYTSSAPDVATISSDGTVVTIINNGSTTITASQQDICGNYLPGSKTGTLTVARKVPAYGAFNPPTKTFGDASFSMVPFAPTTESSATYTYTSSAPSVATISSDGTVVTVIGQGSATITVSQDICGNYAVGSKTGVLTVNRAAPTFLKAFTITDKTFGDAPFSLLPFTDGLDNTDGTYHFSSSNPSIVSISTVDNVTATILAYTPTPITITVDIDICGNYATATTSGTLTVARAVPTYGAFNPPAKTFGNAVFSMVPFAPSTQSSGAYTYTSSAPEVATISSDGTVVTIVGHGSTTITASQDIYGNYLAGSQTGTLTVARKVPVYGTFVPPAKTFGDASFSMVPFAPTSESSATYTYTSSAPSVATISSDGSVVTVIGQGTATITVSQDICGNYTASSKTATLTVARKLPVYGEFTPPAKTFGDAAFSMVPFAPTTESSGVYTYTSSAPSVATISSNGTVVTIVGQGSATITASQDICGNYAAGSKTGTLTVARKETTYGTFTPPAKTFGNAAFSMVPFAPSTDSSGAYTYTSSDPSVATINSTGTVVTIIGQGSTTITASQDICGNYLAGSQTGTLTVARKVPVYGTFTPPAKTILDTSFSMVPFAPTTESSGVYTYTSSAPEVATISSDGTVVTIIGLGSTTITVSQDICGNYAAGSKTGTLTITRKVPDYGAFNPPDKTFGDASFSMVPFAPTSESSATYTYTSSAPNVATISSDGTVVTVIGQGSTTITASQDICGNYQASSKTGTLTVARKAPIYGTFTPPAKTFGDAAFSMVPFAPSTDSSGVYTYTSSNTSVATINSAGTVVTIIGQGYTTITASQDICGNYLAGSQTGTLTIALKVPVYGAFTPPAKIFGNAAFSMVPFAPTSESSGVYTYTSSDPSVATINSNGSVVTILNNGSTTITASQDICGNYAASSKTGTLTVARKVPVYSAFAPLARTFGDASFSMVPFAPTSESSGAYTYTSSAPSVATISSDGSVVTIIGNGSTTITISQDICGNYAASSKTATLTVARKVPVYGTFVPPAMTFGDASFSMVSFAPTSESSGAYTYTSSAPSVATISSDGSVVTIVGQGSTTITASQDICGNYTASSKTATLTVARKVPVYGEFILPVKTFGNAAFSMVPFAPTSESSGAYTYTSSDTNVATISSNGTVVTIIGQGSTTITASQDICGNYSASNTSASLLVVRAAPTFLSAFTVGTKTFGNEPFSLLPFTNGLDNTDGTYHFSSSNSLILSISGDIATILAYSPSPVTITVDIDACGNYAESSTSGTLTILRGPQTFQSVSQVTKTYGDVPFSLVPYMDGISNSSGLYTFTSSNPSAVSIGGDGVTATIHAATPSAITITATQAAAGNYDIGTKTFSLMVNRATPSISGLSNLIKTMIDAPFTLSPTSNSNGTFSYVTDNPTIVFLTNSGTRFNVAGSGLATITATITQDTSGNYNARNYDFTISVGGGTSNLASATFAVPASMTYGDTPVNIITVPTSNSDGAITYTSSNTSIATIHSTTGAITAVAAGSVYFIATQAESILYKSNSVNSNTMTVAVKSVTQSRSSPYTSSTITKYYGDAPFQIETIGESTASKSFSLNISSVVSLSTVSNIANITINNVGTVIITGSQGTNSQYSTQNELTWTLTVEKGTTTLTGLAATLSKNVTDVPFTVAVSSASGGTKSYALSNPADSSILTVNSSSGLVTLKGPGTATIIASQAASSLYNAPSSVSCVITVTEAGSSLQGTTITSERAFNDVNMAGASLSRTTVTSVSFSGATLTNADLSGSTIRNSTLTTAGLAGATLSNADVSGTSFAGATMTSVIMNRVTLTNSTLSTVNMPGASMANAIITGTTFASATMTNAVLTGATLTNSTLTSTVLTGASLVSANVTGSTFVGASLASADLSGATVTNANFTNANISGANITNVVFSPLQKIQLLKNTNNRVINEIQVGDVSGSVIISAISGTSPAAAIPNMATSIVKVVIPTTATISSATLPDVVLDTTTADKFYFPINEDEYFQILGVKYYTSNGIVKNAATNATVEVIPYGNKSIWLIAGSIVANVLSVNTLSNSSFIVPPGKMVTDAPFNLTVAPSSNSDAPIVYSSNNTSVATIHPSTGVITIVGQGYVNFIATQAATLLYEAGTKISNTMNVNILVDFTLSGLNQTILMSTSGLLDGAAIELETTDATVVFYVKVSDMAELFKFQSDSQSANNDAASDIKYFVFNRKWPAALKINPAHGMMNKTESSGMLGSAGMFTENKMLAKHDFIRYLSQQLFNTIHGVDLFSNESDLLENATYWGENVRVNINNILSGISTTSSDVSMNYDVSGNKYLTDSVTANTNICRELMRQMIAGASSRFASIINGTTPQSLPFVENDSINFKVTFQSTATQNLLTGVESIPTRSYMVKLVMKNSVSGGNLNTVVADSEMYPNAYPYSSAVTSYAPTSASSAVYNSYSPPAPIPFARFGFDGWYYSNSNAWVTSSARNRIHWLLPANSGSASVGSLQYIRVNLKIHNKIALPYVIVYTQSNSSRKYQVTNAGALANGTVYSFYVNFNSYIREPAMIGYTNAAMSNTASSGSFASNELILNVALETDSGAAAGTVEFTLSSVIVGDASGEKEYGFEADVPAAYL